MFLLRELVCPPSLRGNTDAPTHHAARAPECGTPAAQPGPGVYRPRLAARGSKQPGSEDQPRSLLRPCLAPARVSPARALCRTLLLRRRARPREPPARLPHTPGLCPCPRRSHRRALGRLAPLLPSPRPVRPLWLARSPRAATRQDVHALRPPLRRVRRRPPRPIHAETWGHPCAPGSGQARAHPPLLSGRPGAGPRLSARFDGLNRATRRVRGMGFTPREHFCTLWTPPGAARPRARSCAISVSGPQGPGQEV